MATKKAPSSRILFDQKDADKAQPPLGSMGKPMRREFVDWLRTLAGVQYCVRSQIWQCAVTGETLVDDWQKRCHERALTMAVLSDRPVLYYHTRAWRADVSGA